MYNIDILCKRPMSTQELIPIIEGGQYHVNVDGPINLITFDHHKKENFFGNIFNESVSLLSQTTVLTCVYI